MGHRRRGSRRPRPSSTARPASPCTSSTSPTARGHRRASRPCTRTCGRVADEAAAAAAWQAERRPGGPAPSGCARAGSCVAVMALMRWIDRCSSRSSSGCHGRASSSPPSTCAAAVVFASWSRASCRRQPTTTLMRQRRPSTRPARSGRRPGHAPAAGCCGEPSRRVASPHGVDLHTDLQGLIRDRLADRVRRERAGWAEAARTRARARRAACRRTSIGPMTRPPDLLCTTSSTVRTPPTASRRVEPASIDVSRAAAAHPRRGRAGRRRQARGAHPRARRRSSPAATS